MKDLRVFLLYFFTIMVLGFVPNLFSCNTIDYKLNMFSYDIIYSEISYDENKASILELAPKEYDNEKSFNSLFQHYYYNEVVFNVRQKVNGLDVTDNLSFYTLPTFSIRTTEEEGGGYYLDSGLFYTYFSDDILGNRGYIQVRNGCDAFTFISDTYADKLLDKYNLSSYSELILNDEYNIIETTCNNGKTIKLCINNIVYSDKRSAPRCVELYGDDFCLVWESNIIKSNSVTSFEFDLKNSPYSCTSVFNNLFNASYTVDEYVYLFRKFENGNYVERIDLNEKYSNIYLNSNDALWITLSVISSFIAVGICIMIATMKSKGFTPFLTFLCLLLVFVIMCLITNFLNMYKYFYLVFMICVCIYGIILRKEIALEGRMFVFLWKKKRFLGFSTKYESIEI